MNAKFAKYLSNKSIFWLSAILGVALVVAAFGYAHFTKLLQVRINRLTAEVAIAEQIQLEAIPQLRLDGFATIIDLRPDGEAVDEPTAAAVESAVHANHMNFSYVPVPHGDIPTNAVTALDKAISENPKPILLYCRSGRRAARTWGLVEASRPGGLGESEILMAVKASGQSADDLKAAIALRIANRTKPVGETK